MSDRERQIPCDFTYMWNIKNTVNEGAKQKQTDNRLDGGLGVLGDKGEGTEKYRLVVTQQSGVHKVSHRKYSR